MLIYIFEINFIREIDSKLLSNLLSPGVAKSNELKTKYTTLHTKPVCFLFTEKGEK